MKSTTQYHYQFQNVGNPEDMEVGFAGWTAMCLALAKWLARVNMNSEIRVRYSRQPIGVGGTSSNDVNDALAEMFASLAKDSDAIDQGTE